MSNFVLISDLIILYHFPAGIATFSAGKFLDGSGGWGWAGLAGGVGAACWGFSLRGGGWLGSLAAGVSACAGGCWGWGVWLLGLASAGGGGCWGWGVWLARLARRLAGFGSGICLSSLACLLRLGAWPALVWGVWLGCCRRDLSRCWFRLAA